MIYTYKTGSQGALVHCRRRGHRHTCQDTHDQAPHAYLHPHDACQGISYTDIMGGCR